MSTNDVPGANPDNHDELRMGCWAEHADGSLIFVYSTEADRVIFSIFDPNQRPMLEYRHAMPTGDFEQQFSVDADDIDAPAPRRSSSIRGSGVVWTWHDKTPFPWDRLIQAGALSGPRYASAADTLSAAERVARDLRARASNLDVDDARRRARGRPDDDDVEIVEEMPRSARTARTIRDRIQSALDALFE